jgi:hypothetical protein
MPVSKAKLYADQQKEILQKLLDIVGVNGENKAFYLYDLDHDADKQARILALKDDIRQYFSAGNSRLFQKRGDMVPEREYLLIVRNVLKYMKIPFVMTSIKIKIDNKWVATRQYILL